MHGLPSSQRTRARLQCSHPSMHCSAVKPFFVQPLHGLRYRSNCQHDYSYFFHQSSPVSVTPYLIASEDDSRLGNGAEMEQPWVFTCSLRMPCSFQRTAKSVRSAKAANILYSTHFYSSSRPDSTVVGCRKGCGRIHQLEGSPICDSVRRGDGLAL
jgi:hypothetical protein